MMMMTVETNNFVDDLKCDLFYRFISVLFQ